MPSSLLLSLSVQPRLCHFELGCPVAWLTVPLPCTGRVSPSPRRSPSPSPPHAAMFRWLLACGLPLVLASTSLMRYTGAMGAPQTASPAGGGALSLLQSWDVASPAFDVDWGLSEEERRIRLRSLASTPLKGWNSYDGWDWVRATPHSTKPSPRGSPSAYHSPSSHTLCATFPGLPACGRAGVRCCAVCAALECDGKGRGRQRGLPGSASAVLRLLHRHHRLLLGQCKDGRGGSRSSDPRPLICSTPLNHSNTWHAHLSPIRTTPALIPRM